MLSSVDGSIAKTRCDRMMVLTTGGRTGTGSAVVEFPMKLPLRSWTHVAVAMAVEEDPASVTLALLLDGKAVQRMSTPRAPFDGVTGQSLSGRVGKGFNGYVRDSAAA